MVWLCDELGNTLRRYVLLLNNMKFESAPQRKKCLAELASHGIQRGKVHEVWDAATILLGRLRDNTPCGSNHEPNRMRAANNFADKVLRRLQPVYNRFDKSLRKAEARVCQDLLRQWKQVYKPALVHRIDTKSFASSSSRNIHSKNDDADLLKRDLQRRGTRGAKTSARQTLVSKRSQSSLTTAASLNEEEAMCTICSDTFERNEHMYVTPCNHAFHITCLDDWFKQASVCPICRKDFSQSDDE